MPKEVSKEKLAEMLRAYQRKNVCEHASNQCRGCTFSVNDNKGCAINLVANALALDLSIFKNESDKQWREHLHLESEE